MLQNILLGKVQFLENEKKSLHQSTIATSDLPYKLNTFYAWFDSQNYEAPIQIACNHHDWLHGTHFQVTHSQVLRALQQIITRQKCLMECHPEYSQHLIGSGSSSISLLFCQSPDTKHCRLKKFHLVSWNALLLVLKYMNIIPESVYTPTVGHPNTMHDRPALETPETA